MKTETTGLSCPKCGGTRTIVTVETRKFLNTDTKYFIEKCGNCGSEYVIEVPLTT